MLDSSQYSNMITRDLARSVHAYPSHLDGTRRSWKKKLSLWWRLEQTAHVCGLYDSGHGTSAENSDSHPVETPCQGKEVRVPFAAVDVQRSMLRVPRLMDSGVETPSPPLPPTPPSILADRSHGGRAAQRGISHAEEKDSCCKRTRFVITDSSFPWQKYGSTCQKSSWSATYGRRCFRISRRDE